jgi:polyphosphate kinase
VLQSDGRYVRCNPSGNQHARNAQTMLLEKLTSPAPVR